MNKLCYLALAGLLLSAPGCIISSGDDSDGDPFVVDDDPRGRDQPPETTAACIVPDTGYGAGEIPDYTEGEAFVGETEDGDAYMFAETVIEMGGDTHLISVDVWEDYGVFADAGGWEPGTYELQGDDTVFDACGCCVYILEDYDEATNTYGRLLMADSGEVEITDIDPHAGTGQLDGHLSDVDFREVNEDDQGYYDVEQGCTTSIADYTFDTGVESVDQYPH